MTNIKLLKQLKSDSLGDAGIPRWGYNIYIKMNNNTS